MIIRAGLLSAAFLAYVFFAPVGAAAAEKPEKQEKQKLSLSDKISKSESPIHISADRMEARQQERTLVFEGHVLVQQDDVTLTGARLKVVALPEDKKNPGAMADKIDYIEVEGDVKVTQKDRIATAQKAVFYQKGQKIVLSGRPTVSGGKDKIEGSVITIYLEQGRSVVEGGKEIPVQAVLFPGKKE
ncbi:MAG: LptA/OstA family protein [Syntrophobacteraceae bacterium]